MAKSSRECERLLYPLVRYFHDCLAAQCEWARSVNVIEQKDVTLLALTAHARSDSEPMGDLSCGASRRRNWKLAASGGAEVALSLGALFLVGQMPRPDEGAARRYCAPLLEVPMRLKQLAGGRIVVEPEEIEFSVNYSLVSELLGGDSDDLDDRLADLSELVPDFPIDATEFDTFWNGFRTIAPEVPLSPGLPPRRDRSPRTRTAADKEAEAADSSAAPRRLDIVDFFVPELPGAGVFHLLPATALILGRRSGLPMSALSELAAMDGMPLQTAAQLILDPASARPPRRSSSRRFRRRSPLPLTPAQEAIVTSAAGHRPLTVVTEAAGNGKSYTITAIVLDAASQRPRPCWWRRRWTRPWRSSLEMVERFASLRRPDPAAALGLNGSWPTHRLSADDRTAASSKVARFGDRACSLRRLDRAALASGRAPEKPSSSSKSGADPRQQQNTLDDLLPVLDLDGARARPPGCRSLIPARPGSCRRRRLAAGRLAAQQVSARGGCLNVPADWDCCFEELDRLARGDRYDSRGIEKPNGVLETALSRGRDLTGTGGRRTAAV